jgi:hypothetical protein
MLFDAISSLPALPATPPAAVSAQATLPQMDSAPIVDASAPLPSLALSFMSQRPDIMPVPAPGPINPWHEEAHMPAPAQSEVAPTGSVVLTMELAGTTPEDFTEKQGQFVAAVAKVNTSRISLFGKHRSISWSMRHMHVHMWCQEWCICFMLQFEHRPNINQTCVSISSNANRASCCRCTSSWYI